MKKLASVVLLVSFALSLSACNTMAGIGKDVEKAGEAVQDAAD
jgi:predicted small secreted protein